MGMFMQKEQAFILSVDQGTSGTKTVLFDALGRPVARGSAGLHTFYREGGKVEQDPEAICSGVLESVRNCLENFKAAGGDSSDIIACGITNQRETFVLWDEQGKPLYNAIVWQCKRSVAICERLKADGLEEIFRQKTGLRIDPYFSGTKLTWLCENDPELREKMRRGLVYFGTIDTWLLYRLTNGRQFLTDHTNASRTLFFNLSTLQWDRELIGLLGLTGLNLPEVQASSSCFGSSDLAGLLPREIPVASLIGDSHAAAFGEGCFAAGRAKATLGTGSSLMMNTGSRPVFSSNGMVSTVCWSTGSRIDYALEGVIVTCGATLEWLKNSLGILEDTSRSEAMALAVADSNGVYLVPAFSGLGAPHWEMSRKASITGLTFDCNKNHVVRAALESIPFQLKDVIVAIEEDGGALLSELMVDGGISANRFVLQTLADLLEKPVVNPGLAEVSALGAAFLAGLEVGLYQDIADLERLRARETIVQPVLENDRVKAAYKGWLDVVKNGV